MREGFRSGRGLRKRVISPDAAYSSCRYAIGMKWFGSRHDVDPAPLHAICRALPDRFDYLKEQIDAGLIDRIQERRDGTQRIFYDPDALVVFEDPRERHFMLHGIRYGAVSVELEICFGVIVGYGTDGEIDKSSHVDTSQLVVQYLDSDHKELLADRLSKDLIRRVRPADVQELEIDGESYVLLRHLSDGDALAVDAKGSIVRLSLLTLRIEPAEGEL